jgi:hypothetical protein
MTLERLRRRWEDNIKMDLREGGFERAGWIELAQDRHKYWDYANRIMNHRIPKKKAENFLTR